jgi:hypothetical protein
MSRVNLNETSMNSISGFFIALLRLDLVSEEEEMKVMMELMVREINDMFTRMGKKD